ncbi:AraC family transcriptional regulator, partial [Streptomyces microflavus]|uniref:AraC family transcriptional regulator n=1 Tax=Streptomyces microflavus TaxID=1919 RepID=UPI003688A378
RSSRRSSQISWSAIPLTASQRRGGGGVVVGAPGAARPAPPARWGPAHPPLGGGGPAVGRGPPRRAVVWPAAHDCGPLRDYLVAQIGGARPGHQIVLDRLLDWMLVCTLRDWFDRPEAEPPGWYGALGDEVAGPALRAMHEDPAHPWTTAELAARAGVSRTTLAKRFTELVGDGPVAYLTEWRMTLAADLLTRPELTVAAVARRVGYADAFGFSAAFKRLRGESPSAYRQQASAAARAPGRAAPAG